MLAGTAMARECHSSEPWPLWKAYVKAFSSKDGRFIDRAAHDRTTSEAQAYGLFHSLVANDREQFDLSLRWTEANLAKGDLRSNLPAWNWGGDEKNQWHVLDDASAADADLWMAYALLEAGRLWCEPRYVILAEQIVAQVVRQEVKDLPGLGPMVLPGPRGFQPDKDSWRLNPSYFPLSVLRRLDSARLTGPWKAVINSTLRMFRQASSRDGFMPDWIVYHRERGFIPDGEKERVGSYDAIRNYLWAALVPDDDPDKATIAGRLLGMYRYFKRIGRIPELVDGVAPPNDAPSGPAGFYASLLPMARDMGDEEVFRQLTAELSARKQGDLYDSPPKYYDQNLILFAQGFIEGRYRFAVDGKLEPRWEKRCESP